MLIALFADIHANRQAFEACLEHAHAQGAQRSVLLGDYVGYGADPGWTVDAVKDMVDKGAMAVLGNHDNAVNVPSETMNSMAQTAIEWTRGQLNAEQKAFLARLPLTLQDESRLYVHSEASKPREWIYVKSTVEAATSLASTPAHITFCGHIHQPALYSLSITAKMTSFTPTAGAPVPMLPGAAGWPYSARSASRATAIRRRPTRCSIPTRRKSRIAACPMTLTKPPRVFAKPACRSGWPIACSQENDEWRSRCTNRARWSMASGSSNWCTRAAWRCCGTSRGPDLDGPVLMKVPRIGEGADPAAIVCFEMEQMIAPRLSGVHVPKFIAGGDFAAQPYLGDGTDRGHDAAAAARRTAIAVRRGG